MNSLRKIAKSSGRIDESSTHQNKRNKLRQHSIIPPIGNEAQRSYDQPLEKEKHVFAEPCLGHNFSQITVHPLTPTLDNKTPQVVSHSCPSTLISPRFCPFGGACHTCLTVVQTKLTINQPRDQYEQEADGKAEAVAQMPGSSVSVRAPYSRPAQSSTVPPIVHEVLCSPGQPLDPATCAFMESRFDHDFSRVRIHSDAKTAKSAREVNALAYTVGYDIVFGAGQYAPGTRKGKKLLAHELTHVIQQCGNDTSFFRGISSEASLQLSPAPQVMREWGGFRIYGDEAFVITVRQELNRLNATRTGGALLREISEHRRPWYRRLIPIEPLGACGYEWYGAVQYNTAGCAPRNRCPEAGPDWTAVPNFIYLFHELVHAYEDYIAGRGTHPNRECITTGLGGYFTLVPYSENRLRCELGLPVRPCYDGECTRFPPPACRELERQMEP